MNKGDFVDFVDLRKHIIKNKKLMMKKKTLIGSELCVFNIENLNPTKFFSNIITMMNISHFQSLDKQDKLIILLISI